MLSKYVLDTNCFIAASRNDAAAEALETFVEMAAPRLYLSSVVEAELRSGVTDSKAVESLEDLVFGPYHRRNRIVSPSATSWRVLGQTLSWLTEHEGLVLRTTPRSFIFDILIAHSCRELGAVLVSANERDLRRIRQVFSFEFCKPFPVVV